MFREGSRAQISQIIQYVFEKKNYNGESIYRWEREEKWVRKFGGLELNLWKIVSLCSPLRHPFIVEKKKIL